MTLSKNLSWAKANSQCRRLDMSTEWKTTGRPQVSEKHPLEEVKKENLSETFFWSCAKSFQEEKLSPGGKIFVSQVFLSGEQRPRGVCCHVLLQKKQKHFLKREFTNILTNISLGLFSCSTSTKFSYCDSFLILASFVSLNKLQNYNLSKISINWLEQLQWDLTCILNFFFEETFSKLVLSFLF